MRKPLNLDDLKSELIPLTINKKVYNVGAIPLAYLIKIMELQEDNKRTANQVLVGCMDVIAKIVQIENPEFKRDELNTLDIKQSTGLIRWIITSSNVDEEVEDTKKKSTKETKEKIKRKNTSSEKIDN